MALNSFELKKNPPFLIIPLFNFFFFSLTFNSFEPQILFFCVAAAKTLTAPACSSAVPGLDVLGGRRSIRNERKHKCQRGSKTLLYFYDAFGRMRSLSASQLKGKLLGRKMVLFLFFFSTNRALGLLQAHEAHFQGILLRVTSPSSGLPFPCPPAAGEQEVLHTVPLLRAPPGLLCCLFFLPRLLLIQISIAIQLAVQPYGGN